MNNFLKELKSKLKNNYLIFYIIFLLAGLIIGLSFRNNLNHSLGLGKTENHRGNYSYISPLLECFSEKSDAPENYKLQKKIEDLISTKIKEQKITEASVYFRDLANGPWIGINENEKFTPASLLKVPIMISYYTIAEKDPAILKKEIETIQNYKNTDIPNIKPEIEVETGKKYTVQELINNMIIESDNLAAGTLLSNLPENVLSKTFTELGLELPSVDKPENYMTVKDYASFFRVLYNASYLNKDYSEQSLEILSRTKYKQGLVAGLPVNTKNSHKFGERKNGDIDQLHDCGIIYKKNKDYLLCVMTRGDDFNNLSEVIKDLSKLVYDNVN